MKKTIRIDGMSCAHCARRVEKALNALAGRVQATVDLASKTASIDSARDLDDGEIERAIADAGYQYVR